MKKIFFYLFIISFEGLIILFSCKKEKLCEGCTGNNKQPTAVAGPDQSISFPTDSITLDGNASSDPDGTINKWLWAKISGPPGAFTLSNVITPVTTVKNLVSGIYLFEIMVTDNGGLSAKDTVQITVIDPIHPNQPPIANAGVDQTIILPTNSVILNGSGSTDPDYNITSYLWSKVAGPLSPQFLNFNAVQFETQSLEEGVYLFELKVIDNWGFFAKDTIQVTVLPQALPCDNSNRPQVNAQLIPFGTLSHARSGMAVASAGNKIVFAGASLSVVNGSSVPDYGSSRVDIYDMVSQTWTTAELSQRRSDIAAVAAGNKIFFAGGRLGDGAFDQLFSTVDIYDVSTNTWTVASLSEPRAYISATAVGNKVFFAGGEKDWNYNTSGKVDIYDLSANTWSTATLSEPRAFISAVTVNDKAYFAGGHKEDRWYGDPSNKVDIYNNTSGTWSVSTLNQPMGFLAGIAVTEKIYWAEGCKVEVKDANTWNSSIANLYQPGSWNIVEGQNAVVKNGKIIFFRHSGNSVNKFDIYDIATNTWTIGVLPVSIHDVSIISVNNTIYVAGGSLNGALSNLVWKLEF